MKKKIFFIMSTDDYSGAEAVNFSIIKSLKDTYDFYWVSKKGKINDFLGEEGINWIEIEKLNVAEVKRVIKNYQPDILHATDYKASVICSYVKGKISLIHHLHNNSPWLKKISIYSLTYFYAALKADIILTVSDSIEKEFIFSKFIKHKIKAIGNPVSRKNVLNCINLDCYQKKYDICCVARLTEQKNPLRFISIIKKITKNYPLIKVVWVGDGELKGKVLAKVKSLQLENNIEFVGFQKNPHQYMNESKVFMLTSSWEGYGLVAFESLTLGLPTVVSNVGGLPNIVDNECGLLCETDDDFINEIDKLLNCSSYYDEKRRKAIEKSQKIENIKEYTSTLEKKYSKLLGDTK